MAKLSKEKRRQRNKALRSARKNKQAQRRAVWGAHGLITAGSGITPLEHGLELLGIQAGPDDGNQRTFIEETDRALFNQSQNQPRDPLWLSEVLGMANGKNKEAGLPPAQDIIDNIVANSTSIPGVVVSWGPLLVSEFGDRFGAPGRVAQGLLDMVALSKPAKDLMKPVKKQLVKNS